MRLKGPFHEDTGEWIILFSKGVYYQRDVYVCDEFIFAKHGGGFLRLLKGGLTTNPTVKWVSISPGRAHAYDQYQYMTTARAH